MYFAIYAALVIASLAMLKTAHHSNLALFGFVVAFCALIAFAWGFAAIDGSIITLISAILTLPVEAVGSIAIGYKIKKEEQL
jgi:hypothetical protein